MHQRGIGPEQQDLRGKKEIKNLKPKSWNAHSLGLRSISIWFTGISKFSIVSEPRSYRHWLTLTKIMNFDSIFLANLWREDTCRLEKNENQCWLAVAGGFRIPPIFFELRTSGGAFAISNDCAGRSPYIELVPRFSESRREELEKRSLLSVNEHFSVPLAGSREPEQRRVREPWNKLYIGPFQV